MISGAQSQPKEHSLSLILLLLSCMTTVVLQSGTTDRMKSNTEGNSNVLACYMLLLVPLL